MSGRNIAINVLKQLHHPVPPPPQAPQSSSSQVSSFSDVPTVCGMKHGVSHKLSNKFTLICSQLSELHELSKSYRIPKTSRNVLDEGSKTMHRASKYPRGLRGAKGSLSGVSPDNHRPTMKTTEALYMSAAWRVRATWRCA